MQSTQKAAHVVARAEALTRHMFELVDALDYEIQQDETKALMADFLRAREGLLRIALRVDELANQEIGKLLRPALRAA